MIDIVIIEDLPIVMEGIKLQLNKVEEFNVIGEFNNGKEFIDNLDSIDPDIVLTDIDMPVMNGIEMTLLALSSNPDLKIIALTMFSDRKFYYKMVTAGAKGFVLKQSSVNTLRKAIEEVYNGDSYFSQEILRTVIVEMQGIEEEIIKEKKELLKLSDRETHIIQLICQGLSNKEIAEKLFVSLRTVESTKSRLMQKTNQKNNAGLIIWAIKNKIVSI
ncbi:response regulator transcription factor [Carboxylicivirga linearis]|uniref:Response regulator transcription factor n=1 Tax=Carboxylicivirga linearis TaxID=1628157 RepID=A0ABS5K000_9BACT|nr:response regulator transcription factor [Carboxylicivirga linearis]MBS2100400.1 response regulator transcription factor [Carboxylicivirga linearis]